MDNERDPRPPEVNDVTDEPLHSDKGDLTPPHGDDLRDETTFGRTDRYSNIDEANASREEPATKNVADPTDRQEKRAIRKSDMS